MDGKTRMWYLETGMYCINVCIYKERKQYVNLAYQEMFC